MYVITDYRSTNQNLRTQLTRIIRRAGLIPWEKLFQNLRASRATELVKDHPQHVASAWLGHSVAVADAHYWQVTDSDFDKALENGQKNCHQPDGSNTENGQNYDMQSSANKCEVKLESLEVVTDQELSGTLQNISENCTNVYMPPKGFEPMFRS